MIDIITSLLDVTAKLVFKPSFDGKLILILALTLVMVYKRRF